MDELDAEQIRAIEEGLSEDELALLDLFKKDELVKTGRERAKQAIWIRLLGYLVAERRCLLHANG